MSDKVLLRYVALEHHKFKSKYCGNVFAFREFSPEDSEELKQEVGIVCDRDAFEERIQGNTNFQAFVYQVNPTRVLNYIFSSGDDMYCVYNKGYSVNYNGDKNYVLYGDNLDNDDFVQVDELTALQSQFSYGVARLLCKRDGMLRRIIPKEGIFLHVNALQYYNLRSPINCDDTYAFREFHIGDVESSQYKHGVYCDKTKYLELLHGNTHFHALSYFRFNSQFQFNDLPQTINRVGVVGTVKYVFTAYQTMDCIMSHQVATRLQHVGERYTSSTQNVSSQDVFLEKFALSHQFGLYEAHTICEYNGVMPTGLTGIINMAHQCICPVGNYTLPASMTVSNMTYTVPITDIMDVLPTAKFDMLSSAASLLLASPVGLVPVLLVIENVTNMFFNGLACWLTNLVKKKY